MIYHTGPIHRLLFPSLVWKMNDRRVYLTFDDGPHPVATKKVLNVLSQYSTQGTFFLSGQQIPGNESLVDTIVQNGHSIGIHSYFHKRTTQLSRRNSLSEIVSTEHLITNITPHLKKIYRPPFGFFSWNTLSSARISGYRIIMWSSLTKDFTDCDNSEIIFFVLKHLTPGSILVFHDNNNTAHRIDLILDSIIPLILGKGLSFGVF